MRVLGLDTATAAVSVAVWDGPNDSPNDSKGRGRVLAREYAEMERGQAQALMPMVQRVMAAADTTFDGLDRIAVTRGPGAFTGIRIGLAAARGLGIAAGIPVMGVTTFAAVAAAVDENERADRALLVTLDTKRGDFYAALFTGASDDDEGRVIGPDDMAAHIKAHAPDRGLLVAGDGAYAAVKILTDAGFDAVISAAPRRPDAARIAELGALTFPTGPDNAMPEPLYLRPPAVRLPGGERIG